MARPKKATAVKSIKKALPKKIAKVSKTKTTAKTTSATPDLLSTIKSFASENKKQFAILDKQLDGLRVKAEKAIQKQRETKDKRVEIVAKMRNKPSAALEKQLEKVKQSYIEAAASATTHKNELASVRDALRIAKDNAAKFSALSKLVEKFEKQWNKKTKAAPQPQAKAKAEPQEKASAGKKRGRKPKAIVTKPMGDVEENFHHQEAPEHEEAFA